MNRVLEPKWPSVTAHQPKSMAFAAWSLGLTLGHAALAQEAGSAEARPTSQQPSLLQVEAAAESESNPPAAAEPNAAAAEVPPAPVYPAPVAPVYQGPGPYPAAPPSALPPAAAPPPPPPAPRAPRIDLGASDVAPPAAEPEWWEDFDFGAFADGFYGINYNNPRPNADANARRVFDRDNRFALSWVGVDIAYPAAPVGGTLNLRFGPSAPILAGAIDTAEGLDVVKQAYASWKPAGPQCALTLDFGKFDTIYGAEVAESQLNFNYTRGFLYNEVRPFFHTGLRALWELSETVQLTGLVVNGWNNSVDNNSFPSLGLKFSYLRPSVRHDRNLVEFHLGYLVGPEQADVEFLPCDQVGNNCIPNPDPDFVGTPVARDTNNTEGLRHFVDLVLSLNPSENLQLVLNGDLYYERTRLPSPGIGDPNFGAPGDFDNTVFWGLAVLGRYAVDSTWAVAARGELIDGVSGAPVAAEANLYSGTLTIEAAPSPNLIVRLENRLDVSNEEVFRRVLRAREDQQLTTTLGVVVTTN